MDDALIGEYYSGITRFLGPLAEQPDQLFLAVDALAKGEKRRAAHWIRRTLETLSGL